MARAQRVRVDGLKECEAALAELPKATGRSVLRRVLTKRGQPIADRASQLAPDDPMSAPPDLKTSIFVSTKLKNNVGKSAFAAVLKGGGTKAEATAALRTARRAAGGEGSFAEVYVGPDAKHFYGTFQEFGTVHMASQPFMRPAWDEGKGAVLDGIKDDIWKEIEAAVKRRAKRQARLKR